MRKKKRIVTAYRKTQHGKKMMFLFTSTTLKDIAIMEFKNQVGSMLPKNVEVIIIGGAKFDHIQLVDFDKNTVTLISNKLIDKIKEL